MTKSQFADVVDMLQDVIEGLSMDLDDEDEDDVDVDEGELNKGTTPIAVDKKPAESLKSQNAVSAVAIPLASKKAPVVEVEDDEDEDEASEEEMKEAAREVYDELLAEQGEGKGKGKGGGLSVSALFAWEDVAELIEAGEVTRNQVEALVAQTVGGSASVSKAKKGAEGDGVRLSFDQFYEVVSGLDKLLDEEVGEGEGEGEIHALYY